MKLIELSFKSNKDKFAGTYTRLPERNEVAQDINESLIVEYYNKLL